MEEVRIFLLDLNAESGLGFALEEILKSCNNPQVCLRGQCQKISDNLSISVFATLIAEFNPCLVFLVLPSDRHPQTREMVQALNRRLSGIPVVAVMDLREPEDMIELLKMGVIDFIITPFRKADVIPRIWHLIQPKLAEEKLLLSLKEKLGLKQMVGESPAFLAEINKIPVVAQCDASVLISGETGTGKELFARAIHYLSPRAGKPFIPVSCGAIPVELMENELFGHVRGAFTGAAEPHPGLIREAEGGTIFFDEIDCFSLSAQVKILRLLQEKEYKPLGSPKFHEADIRIIGATNLDLEKAVKEGKFRQDLFYRLNIIPFLLLPLRERQEDIPLLARHFLDKYALEFKKPARDFSGDALKKLLAYQWPGNVRELENVIQRSVIFSRGRTIEYAEAILPPNAAPLSKEPFKMVKAKAIEQFEKRYIQELLASHQGNISRAAEAVHKNRRAFWELIRKYKIDVTSLKSPSKPG